MLKSVYILKKNIETHVMNSCDASFLSHIKNIRSAIWQNILYVYVPVKAEINLWSVFTIRMAYNEKAVRRLS